MSQYRKYDPRQQDLRLAMQNPDAEDVGFYGSVPQGPANAILSN
jgi:hypothetical protein